MDRNNLEQYGKNMQENSDYGQYNGSLTNDDEKKNVLQYNYQVSIKGQNPVHNIIRSFNADQLNQRQMSSLDKNRYAMIKIYNDYEESLHSCGLRIRVFCTKYKTGFY